MLIWVVIHTILSLLLAAVLIYLLYSWFDGLILVERVGMALMAGSVLLTVPVMWTGDSPFDYWSTAVLRVGALIYFLGRLLRLYRHHCRNRESRRQALEWQHSKTGSA